MMDIGKSLAELGTLDRTTLLERWQSAFGHVAPRHIRSEMIQRTLGWHVQVQAYGGLDGEMRRKLRRISPGLKLATGTRLIRVWQGVSHQVTVLDTGFAYEGKTWRSLSAIARAITGTSWNGKVFFGVIA
ncbi:hypothetical protein NNRS527_00977 [Nitrosospira sp. NRS527]|nr:hypothetical protein NNRS527_00977 [Nitrosospira sp. NRS527]